MDASKPQSYIIAIVVALGLVFILQPGAYPAYAMPNSISNSDRIIFPGR